MDPGELERQIAGLAALDDPVRRRLYFFVASRPGEVSREEAARAVGVSRPLAGFHLDRLAEQGLLETSFRRLSGKSGPGAGRPAKLYRRSGRELAVSLPERRYELAARILASAVEAARAGRVRARLGTVAHRVGELIGRDARARAGGRAGRTRRLESAMAALADQGYEPVRTGGEIRLRNCPFHALATEHLELVCGMNLDLIRGVVDGLEVPGVRVVLDPQPEMCCVALRRDRRPDGPGRNA